MKTKATVRYAGKSYRVYKGIKGGHYIIRKGKKVRVLIGSYPDNINGRPVGYRDKMR